MNAYPENPATGRSKAPRDYPRAPWGMRALAFLIDSLARDGLSSGQSLGKQT